MFSCRILPLPLRDYMLHTLARVSRDKRKLTIYDQLNPSYVRFYARDEVRELLQAAGHPDLLGRDHREHREIESSTDLDHQTASGHAQRSVGEGHQLPGVH